MKGLTMGNRKGLTLLETLVVVFIILFLLAIFIPPRDVSHHAERVVCGASLKWLGTAMTVYSSDYDGAYPELPGGGPWAKELGFAYNETSPEFGAHGAQSQVGRTISASWYLLVREEDVEPKLFVCKSSDQLGFERANPDLGDVTELWDFGADPYKHVSYSMQNPYGKYPAHSGLSADFAVAADMNPWIRNGDFVKPGVDKNGPGIIDVTKNPKTWCVGNYPYHKKAKRGSHGGQNVLFGDGHTYFKKCPNVGMKQDNIYTFWSKDEAPSEQGRQGGVNPTGRDGENDAKSEDDSFLVL
jgi:prepilin-type processing-associated H-X9-DG protein